MYLCMHVCIPVYVCVYVCMYVCMYNIYYVYHNNVIKKDYIVEVLAVKHYNIKSKIF